MSAPQTRSSSGERVEALDLLRLVAVLAVMLFHYGFRGAAADGYTMVALPGIEGVAKYGYLGVQMFFVISGFVIAYSADGRSAAGFAIARIARIYPAFLFCMTATFLITLTLGAPRFETTLTQWAANVFIAAPALKQAFMDGAYWSIVYEITFYAWVLLFIALGIFRRRIEMVVLAWLGVSLLNELALGSDPLRKILLTDESGFFAAGLVLYEMFRGRRGAVLQGLFAGTVACASIQAVINLGWMREHFAVTFDSLVVAAVCIAAIAAVTAAVQVRRVPLRPAVVVAIGGLTYPLYLLHQHIGYIALNRLAGRAAPAVLVAGVMTAMVAVSWLVWRYLDRPGQKLVKAALMRVAERLSIPVGKPLPSPTAPTASPLSGASLAQRRAALHGRT